MTWFNKPVILIGFFIIISVANQLTFANHGKEINLKFSDAQFFLSPVKNISQVKFTVIYSVSDQNIVGQLINGIMQIYADNGTLIKTTSIPNGFKVDKNGFQQFVTSMPATSIKKISALVSFTDLNKTLLLSNTVNRNLSLNATE
jgi:hypothetical protein